MNRANRHLIGSAHTWLMFWMLHVGNGDVDGIGIATVRRPAASLKRVPSSGAPLAIVAGSQIAVLVFSRK